MKGDRGLTPQKSNDTIMAKKKTAKKVLKPKAAKRTSSRAKAVTKRKAAAAPSAKKRATGKKTKSAKKTAKKTVKKTVAKKKKGGKKAVSAKTRVKAAAAPKPKPTPAPVYSSSVIRIKTNAPSKRRPAGNRKSKANQSPEATAHDPIQYPEESRRLPKTHLAAKDLREFKALLLQKRAELCGDVERLSVGAFRKHSDSSDHANMPIHMADLGSDNWEQDFALDLIDNERSRVAQIDEALRRIEKKTYGICIATHKKISVARLRAKPWAKYCIEFARAREEGRAY